MFAEACHDRLRFRLNDDSGVLRFTDFQILNAPMCRGMDKTLQEHLVDRALADVDLEYLRKFTCEGDGECLNAVIREVQEYQHLFVRNCEAKSATC